VQSVPRCTPAHWWYPAWGYDPYYSCYDYNGPIYGYDGLQPDEIIANVQAVLQQLGYYPYEVDGVLGPATEAAIANYQRDYGLSVTGAIDQPTVMSLVSSPCSGFHWKVALNEPWISFGIVFNKIG
jgi:putative peptidoglycan binding protein